MKEKNLTNLYLLIFSVIIGIGGIFLLLTPIGWKGVVGLMLILWGNNIGIEMESRKKNEQRK